MRERTSTTGAFGRGGKRSREFGDQEGVAGEHDAHVVVPAYERASFVVVQAELALEVLVGPLDAPAALERVHHLLERGLHRHRAEHKLGGCRLAFGPFDEQPLRLPRLAVVAVDDDASTLETRSS